MVTAADVVGTAALGESVSKISRAGKRASAVQMCDESGAAMNVIKGKTTIRVELVPNGQEQFNSNAAKVVVMRPMTCDTPWFFLTVIYDRETGKLLGQVDADDKR